MLPTVAVVVTWLGALIAVPADGRWAVVVCGLVATLVTAGLSFEAARRGRALAELTRQRQEREHFLHGRMTAQEAQLLHLADEVLPRGVERIQRGDFIEDILTESAAPDGTVAPELQAAAEAALRTVLEAVDAEETLRESAQRAFVNIARRVQAIVHRQAQDLRAMEDRHGEDPAVFDDLLRLDHGNALVGRLADSIAVLGGARPGRQWGRSVPLYSVLRGAMSRILDYQRVELHPVSEVAVIGPAVEPLIHALAELLDNATRYSPPHTRVHLTAVEVQSGIAVEIEDGGLSLSEEGRARAERMLREAQAGIDLNDLGETPRLGLAVVGRLARANGFQVSLRPSAYGGVRAVLVVPRELITTAPGTGMAHGIGVASGPRVVGSNERHRSGVRQPAAAVNYDAVAAALSGPTVEAPRPEPVSFGSANGDGEFGQTGFRSLEFGSPGFGSAEFGGAEFGHAESGGRDFGGRDFGGTEFGEDPSGATEPRVAGLPQRRRRSLRPDLAGKRVVVPEQTGEPAVSGSGPGSPGGRSETSYEQQGVQPGLWLAAFQSGVSDPQANGSEDSTGSGERGDH
ncbi:ATP-binding protein [Streptacidiphilus fuscans]|uniref:ATP-binding protein n=1 Tax=Streptacidiphilus fuscans TaxID=2789292 RepID=UPI001F3C790A|nr:ATP-binding protein [Streptacidiphilus fuscans]